jgi:hypothetical protein
VRATFEITQWKHLDIIEQAGGEQKNFRYEASDSCNEDLKVEVKVYASPPTLNSESNPRNDALVSASRTHIDERFAFHHLGYRSCGQQRLLHALQWSKRVLAIP